MQYTVEESVDHLRSGSFPGRHIGLRGENVLVDNDIDAFGGNFSLEELDVCGVDPECAR